MNAPALRTTRSCPYAPPEEHTRIRNTSSDMSQVTLSSGHVSRAQSRLVYVRAMLTDPRYSSDRRDPNFPQLPPAHPRAALLRLDAPIAHPRGFAESRRPFPGARTGRPTEPVSLSRRIEALGLRPRPHQKRLAHGPRRRASCVRLQPRARLQHPDRRELDGRKRRRGPRYGRRPPGEPGRYSTGAARSNTRMPRGRTSLQPQHLPLSCPPSAAPHRQARRRAWWPSAIAECIPSAIWCEGAMEMLVNPAVSRPCRYSVKERAPAMQPT